MWVQVGTHTYARVCTCRSHVSTTGVGPQSTLVFDMGSLPGLELADKARCAELQALTMFQDQI